MNKLTLALAALASVAACGAPVDPAPKLTPGPHYTLTSAEKNHVMERVRAGLKDPYSAKFGPIKARGVGDDTITVNVCGLLNAKNSYGAYTGYKMFYGYLAPGSGIDFFVGDVGGDSYQQNAIANMCSEFGITLP